MFDIEDKATVCQQFLETVYQDLSCRQTGVAPRRVAETYGEIRYAGVAALLAAFPLTAEDVFVDLGSGLGKLAMQVFLTSRVREVRGIELLSALHAQALQAEARVREIVPEIFLPPRELRFQCGDFLQGDDADATVVLLGSPCFGPDLVGQIGERLNAMSGLRLVFSLRPVLNLRKLRFWGTVRVPCSWDVALCYVYSTLAF